MASETTSLSVDEVSSIAAQARQPVSFDDAHIGSLVRRHPALLAMAEEAAMMKEMARDGRQPELDFGLKYWTCTTWSNDGEARVVQRGDTRGECIKRAYEAMTQQEDERDG